MIEFVIDEKDKNIVRIWCDTDLQVNEPMLGFRRNETDPYIAELVRLRLQKQMEGKLRNIREDAYNEGYRDGKCHRAKRTFFSKWW